MKQRENFTIKGEADFLALTFTNNQNKIYQNVV